MIALFTPWSVMRVPVFPSDVFQLPAPFSSCDNSTLPAFLHIAIHHNPRISLFDPLASRKGITAIMTRCID